MTYSKKNCIKIKGGFMTVNRHDGTYEVYADRGNWVGKVNNIFEALALTK